MPIHLDEGNKENGDARVVAPVAEYSSESLSHPDLSSGRTILVVDDEEAIRRIIELYRNFLFSYTIEQGFQGKRFCFPLGGVTAEKMSK